MTGSHTIFLACSYKAVFLHRQAAQSCQPIKRNLLIQTFYIPSLKEKHLYCLYNSRLKINYTCGFLLFYTQNNLHSIDTPHMHTLHQSNNTLLAYNFSVRGKDAFSIELSLLFAERLTALAAQKHLAPQSLGKRVNAPHYSF